MTLKFALEPSNAEDILYTQAGTPTLDLRFASNKSLVDHISGQNLITFTRSGDATYFDANGVLQTAGTDVARFDHDPVTGESLGLLIEESRTNLLLQSEDFSTSWTVSDASISTNATPAPTGAVVADKLVESAVNTAHTTQQNAPVNSGLVYTFSVYAKPAERSAIALRLSVTSFGAAVTASYDLTSQAATVVTAGTSTSASIIAVGDGWYRCSLTSQATASATTSKQILLESPAGTRSYQGDGTSGLYLWGAQLEAGAFPTSYIPTTSAAVTRSADVASIPASVFRKFFVASPASWLLEAYPISTTVNATYLEGFEGASLKGLTVTVGGVSGDRCRILQRHGSSRIDTGATGPVVTPLQRFRASIGVSDTSAVYVNNQNITGASTTQVDWTPSSGLSIGSRAAGTSLPGTFILSRLCIFDRRLGNDTLQAITSDTAPTTYGNLVLDSANTPQAIAGVAPTLDYRFARDKREIETVSLVDKLTYTGGNGTFVGSDGYIQPATTNVPRFDHDPLSRISEGLLVEEQRTNSIRNNTMVGAVAGTPGTLPTNWISAFFNGLSLSIIGTGNENGITYLDARVSGTVTSAPQALIGFETTTAIPAVTGQDWTVSAYLRLIDGSFNNVNAVQIRISERTAAGAFIQNNNSTPIVPSSSGLVSQRFAHSSVLSGATTGNVQPFLVISTSIGAVVDFTIRIGLPQLEQGAFATSVIPTTTATVTRTADSATIDGTGVLTGTYTIVEKPAGCAVESGGNIELQAGYTAERVMVFPASLSAQQITDIRSAM